MREKMFKQPPPAPTTSTVGPCPTLIQISKALEVYPAPSLHPTTPINESKSSYINWNWTAGMVFSVIFFPMICDGNVKENICFLGETKFRTTGSG